MSKTYTPQQIIKLFSRVPLTSSNAGRLIERLQDHGYIERTADLDFALTKRGSLHLSTLPKPEPKPKVKRVRKPRKKVFKPVVLEKHERKFAHLFSKVWNAIGFDIRDSSIDELEEMTPDVIAEFILDCSYIETYCTSPSDLPLIAELRALPYKEQKRLATGENFGF